MPRSFAFILFTALAPALVAFRQQETDVPPSEQPEHVRPPLPSPEEIAALPPDGGPEWNRLVFEASPYLSQHAANPVDWFPWGDEAFEKAKKEGKPIFLSVGYSTCHWCHVMEHESFEDEEVAALLNEHFVCVKVDREERPDVDHVYMNVTQGLTGSGGWPNTIVMTPEGEPFFAATYLPKNSRFGRKGLMELVPEIGQLWREKESDLREDAGRIATELRRSAAGPPGAGGELGAKTLAQGFARLADRFDPEQGGFAQRPKFPVPHNLEFLLQHHRRTGNPKALAMVETTLRTMRRGGIWDHLGYGFHRYSVDERWLLPHFEKMLYDQALIAMAYVAAWQVTDDHAYRATAEEIFTYVRRDLTSPEGAFYSAEDADSEGEEGLFYVWTAAEIDRLLGPEGELFKAAYGVAAEGNFHDEATRQATGRNVLHLVQTADELATRRGEDADVVAARLERARRILFEHREGRVRPLRDDKVLTDWNGLMIAALSRAATAFGAERHAADARRAAEFVLAHLMTEDGRLLKRWRAGEAGLPGTLEDHAFLAWGLLELYEATFEVRWLQAAKRCVDGMVAHFHDAEKGGFFLGADDGEELFLRGKEFYDGAIPSGNSVAAFVLLRLARMTGESGYEELAADTFRAASPRVAAQPDAYPRLLTALDFAVGPSYEVVVAGDPKAADTRAMLAALRRPYLPHKVLLLRPPGEAPPITELAPYTGPQGSLEGRAAAYVCRDFACEQPTTDPTQALASLGESP